MAADGLKSAGNALQTWRKQLSGITMLGAILACVALFALFVIGWLIVVDDPFGGEPVTVIALDRPSAIQADSGDDLDIRPTVDSLEAEPLPSGHTEPPADIVISDPLATARQQPEVDMSALDLGLVENSQYGPLPVVSRDGRRPAEVYSSATAASKSEALPRIAIVIGGMGLSTTATETAIDTLPREVTLAFAPYGAEVDRLASRARQSGHELALQMPLEPYDYPDNDPGPHTLLTGLSSDQNRDRLHWVMSRFTGYVGVLNYMGARFTASDESLRPILGELRDRGLIYLDDGSSPRSLAGNISSEVGLPFAQANLVIDAVPSQEEIESQLSRLVEIAKLRGIAIGVGSGLPITIHAVDEWADRLKDEGVLLVPASVVASGGQT